MCAAGNSKSLSLACYNWNLIVGAGHGSWLQILWHQSVKLYTAIYAYLLKLPAEHGSKHS